MFTAWTALPDFDLGHEITTRQASSDIFKLLSLPHAPVLLLVGLQLIISTTSRYKQTGSWPFLLKPPSSPSRSKHIAHPCHFPDLTEWLKTNVRVLVHSASGPRLRLENTTLARVTPYGLHRTIVDVVARAHRSHVWRHPAVSCASSWSHSSAAEDRGASSCASNLIALWFC